MLHAVIMAGGSGTRFWPKSTKKTPKQFLSLFGDESLLQTTVRRIEPLVSSERLWVITNSRYVDLVKEQLPELPASNIIGEAVAKSTAPCVAAAAALIQKQDKKATMVVLPSDHLVGQPDKFLSVLQAGVEKAEQSQTLLTIGIKPTRPETGYGYIEFDKNSGEEAGGHQVRRVRQFREKPDITTARQFIYADRFLWNSGMFIWTVSTIIDEFNHHLPEVSRALDDLQSALSNDDSQAAALENFYQSCPRISIDYGIMERADDVFVIPAAFGWNDVGSWKALYELTDKDENDNVLKASRTAIEQASGNIVNTNSEKMIALVGVENLAVVETEDAILVCNLDHAQGVKQIVQQLEKAKEPT